MKIRDVIIGILLIIIAGQFIQFYLLSKEFERLKFIDDQYQTRVYIAGLTQKLQEVDRVRGEVIWQAVWFNKRLGKCIEMLEKEKGLQPIPIEWPKPDWMLKLRSDPNMVKKYEPKSEPFFEPYQEPNLLPLKQLEERPIAYAMCGLNLQQLSLLMLKERFNNLIANYE
jgi:hypothetical protein